MSTHQSDDTTTISHDKSGRNAQVLRIGEYSFDRSSGKLSGANVAITLEPKVADLLLLLADRAGQVVSREDIDAALWPGVVVGEDTLARTVSKLRKALADDTKEPTYLETLPKRGYRLVAAVEAASESNPCRSVVSTRALLFATALVVVAFLGFFMWPDTEQESPGDTSAARLSERGDDFYIKMERAANESAISLYEQAISIEPSYAQAQSGLANALVQRVIRWPYDPDGTTAGASSLTEAMERGLTQSPAAVETLERAQALAERAAASDPRNPAVLKALGFVYSAQGELDEAMTVYEQAIDIDPNAWEPMINIGELHLIRGEPRSAIGYFERAYEAMAVAYEFEPQRIVPWHADLGAMIGRRYESLDEMQEAEIWYRRVLATSPFHPVATAQLAAIVADSGDLAQAQTLCEAATRRVGKIEGCEDFSE